MHRPYYHNGYDAHGEGIAEICKECSHDDVLVPVSFCPEAMKYLEAEDRILDLVGKWHDGEGFNQELYEYLGWSDEEYTHWANKHQLPKHFIDEQTKD